MLGVAGGRRETGVLMLVRLGMYAVVCGCAGGCTRTDMYVIASSNRRVVVQLLCQCRQVQLLSM